MILEIMVGIRNLKFKYLMKINQKIQIKNRIPVISLMMSSKWVTFMKSLWLILIRINKMLWRNPSLKVPVSVAIHSLAKEMVICYKWSKWKWKINPKSNRNLIGNQTNLNLLQWPFRNIVLINPINQTWLQLQPKMAKQF